MRDDTTVDAREGAKHGAGARKHARTSLTSNDTRTITSTFWSALGGSARPKLVALTGWGKDEDRHRSDDAGFDAHVVKPVDGAKLLADIGAARQGYAVDSRTK